MKIRRREELDISIVMPCLNEEKTVGSCVDEAFRFIRDNNLDGEVIVVDNASTDRSAEIADAHGARVIFESRKGYGRALRSGFAESRGRVVIMADCDTTYDLYHISGMYKLLAKQKYDMMIGDRFAGGIEKGAMPLSHKIGARMLSFVARLRFHTRVKDFHCGIRGFTREALCRMTLRTTGMEFATELIAEAVRKGLRIGQVPVKLRRCEVSRHSKLRTIRDGMRHMKYILRTRVR